MKQGGGGLGFLGQLLGGGGAGMPMMGGGMPISMPEEVAQTAPPEPEPVYVPSYLQVDPNRQDGKTVYGTTVEEEEQIRDNIVADMQAQGAGVPGEGATQEEVEAWKKNFETNYSKLREVYTNGQLDRRADEEIGNFLPPQMNLEDAEYGGTATLKERAMAMAAMTSRMRAYEAAGKKGDKNAADIAVKMRDRIRMLNRLNGKYFKHVQNIALTGRDVTDNGKSRTKQEIEAADMEYKDYKAATHSVTYSSETVDRASGLLSGDAGTTMYEDNPFGTGYGDNDARDEDYDSQFATFNKDYADSSVYSLASKVANQEDLKRHYGEKGFIGALTDGFKVNKTFRNEVAIDMQQRYLRDLYGVDRSLFDEDGWIGSTGRWISDTGDTIGNWFGGISDEELAQKRRVQARESKRRAAIEAKIQEASGGAWSSAAGRFGRVWWTAANPMMTVGDLIIGTHGAATAAKGTAMIGKAMVTAAGRRAALQAGAKALGQGAWRAGSYGGLALGSAYMEAMAPGTPTPAVQQGGQPIQYTQRAQVANGYNQAMGGSQHQPQQAVATQQPQQPQQAVATQGTVFDENVDRIPQVPQNVQAGAPQQTVQHGAVQQTVQPRQQQVVQSMPSQQPARRGQSGNNTGLAMNVTTTVGGPKLSQTSVGGNKKKLNLK